MTGKVPKRFNPKETKQPEHDDSNDNPDLTLFQRKLISSTDPNKNNSRHYTPEQINAAFIDTTQKIVEKSKEENAKDKTIGEIADIIDKTSNSKITSKHDITPIVYKISDNTLISSLTQKESLAEVYKNFEAGVYHYIHTFTKAENPKTPEHIQRSKLLHYTRLAHIANDSSEDKIKYTNLAKEAKLDYCKLFDTASDQIKEKRIDQISSLEDAVKRYENHFRDNNQLSPEYINIKALFFSFEQAWKTSAIIYAKSYLMIKEANLGTKDTEKAHKNLMIAQQSLTRLADKMLTDPKQKSGLPRILEEAANRGYSEKINPKKTEEPDVPLQLKNQPFNNLNNLSERYLAEEVNTLMENSSLIDDLEDLRIDN